MKTKRMISFTPVMYSRLQARAEKLDISLSELVRRILDEYLATTRTK
jgi:hypothetical protein